MGTNNVIRLFPEPIKKPEPKIKPLAWAQNLIRNYREKQDELRRKKVDFLIEQTYFYYIDLKIAKMDELDEVDFHPSLYAAGIVIDSKCQRLALEAVTENVLKYGARRIDACFSKAIKQFKKANTYRSRVDALKGCRYVK